MAYERSRSPSTPSTPYEVASRGPAIRWARATRLSENEPTHTRSHAPARAIRLTSGYSADSALMSTFQRASGNSSSRSSRSDSGSVPATRAALTCFHGSSAIRPRASVTRSRVASWKATSLPSAVACTSVSKYR